MTAKGLLVLRTVILCVCVKMFSVIGFYVMVLQLLIPGSFYNNIFKVPEVPKKPVQEEKVPILVKKKKDLPPAKVPEVPKKPVPEEKVLVPVPKKVEEPPSAKVPEVPKKVPEKKVPVPVHKKPEPSPAKEVPEIPRPAPEEAPTFVPEEEEEEEAIPEIPVKGTTFLPENYLKALFSSSDLHL
ncbi:titin-like [Lagopus muta]|uniref:titin-like n=1 Tax=Lagopus muta TaxID=64668 RepID=UPI0020A0B8DF|nr:titin-like [Lagopus muta]